MDGFMEFMLRRAWEELMLSLLLWGPLLVLAGVCVSTLDQLPAQRRRGLFALFFTMLGLAAVLFGGAWVLDRNDLAWRTWFQEGMSGVLWLVGLATGTLTVLYAGRWLPERHRMAGKFAVGASALCLASVMLVGTVFGGLWCLGPGERVGTYQGRKVVQGRWMWSEGIYELYEYHGPLVRGKNSIAWAEDPLVYG